jgi:hypothetical protein
MGVIGVEGLRQIKYLPQSPFTGQFFLDNDNSIAFYESKLSTRRSKTTYNVKNPHV